MPSHLPPREPCLQAVGSHTPVAPSPESGRPAKPTGMHSPAPESPSQVSSWPAMPRPRMLPAASIPSLPVPGEELQVRTLTSASPCVNRDGGQDPRCREDQTRQWENRRVLGLAQRRPVLPHPHWAPLCSSHAPPVPGPGVVVGPQRGCPPARLGSGRTGTGVRVIGPPGAGGCGPALANRVPTALPAPPNPRPASDARISLGGKRHERIQEPEASRPAPPNGSTQQGAFRTGPSSLRPAKPTEAALLGSEGWNFKLTQISPSSPSMFQRDIYVG